MIITINPIHNGDDYEAVADLLYRFGYAEYAGRLQESAVTLVVTANFVAELKSIVEACYGPVTYTTH